MDLTKVLAVFTIATFFAWHKSAELSSLALLGAEDALVRVGSMSLQLLGYIAAGLVALGSLDFGLQRWRVDRELRVDRSDLNREALNAEGGINKRRRAQLARRFRVRTWTIEHAKVVVCDDAGRIAVALAHEELSAALPRVVARAAGEGVHKLRQMALEKGIFIVSRPSLARALYAGSSSNAEIAPALCHEVAVVFAEAYWRHGAGAVG